MSLDYKPRGWFYASVLALIELGLFCFVILLIYIIFKKWGVIT